MSSKIVDERVVSMEFDNKNFEKNVNQTIKSLNALKQALNVEETTKQVTNISKSLSNLEKSITSSNLADVVTKKFSFFGTIADQLVRTFTNKATNLITGTISSAIAGGEARAQKLADANFMLKGVLGDTTESAEQLDKVMTSVSDSVDGTAYSLDAAATVAAQLAATGMRGGQEMTNTLRGVAGTAAMTNSSFEEIGMIYTKVMAKGHLMADQVNQLAYRGLNVTEELAKSLGKTGEEITKMVTKGQIDFKTFSDALYNAFGEHAAKANDTYSGSLANLHSAFNRIGADVAATKFEALKNIFNALRPLVNAVRKELQPMIAVINRMQMAASNFLVSILSNKITEGSVTKIVKGLVNVFNLLYAVFLRIRRAFQNAFPDSVVYTIEKFADEFYALTESLLNSQEFLDALEFGFMVLFRAIKLCAGAIKFFMGLMTSIPSLIKNVPDLFKKIHDGLSGFGQTLYQNFMHFGPLILQGLALGLAYGVVKVIQVTAQIAQAIIKTFCSILEIHSPSQVAFEIGLNVIKGLVKGLLFGLELVVNAVKIIVENIVAALKGGWDSLGSGTVYERLLVLFEKVKVFGDKAIDTIKNFVSTLNWGYVVIIAFTLSIIRLMLAFSKFTETSTKLVGGLVEIKDGIVGVLKETKSYIKTQNALAKGNNFLKIAGGIALIAASLAAFVFVLKDADIGKIWAIAGALAVLSAAILISAKAGGGDKAVKMGATVGSLGFTLLAIAAAIKIVDSISTKDLKEFAGKVFMLAVIFGAIVAATYAMSQLKSIPKGFAGLSAAIGAMSLAVLASAKALDIIGDVDPTDLNMKTENLLSIVIAMGLIMTVFELVSKIDSDAMSRKVGFFDRVGFAVAIVGLAWAIKLTVSTLASVPFDKFNALMRKVRHWIKEIAVTAAAMVGIGFLILSLTKGIQRIGQGVAAFGLGIFAIAGSLVLISKIPIPDLIKAGITVGIAFAALVAIAKYTEVLPKDTAKKIQGAGKTILAIAGAIFIMSAALALLSLVHPASLIVPTIAIGVLLAVMSKVLEKSYGIKDAYKTVNALTKFMLVMSLLIAIMGVAAGIATRDLESAMGFFVAFITIIGIMASVAMVMEKLQNVKIGKNVKETISAIALTMLALLAGMAGIAALSAHIGWGHVLGAFIYTMLLIEQLEAVTISLHGLTSKKFDPKMMQVVLSIISGLAVMVWAVVALSLASSKAPGSTFASFAYILVMMEQLELVVTALHGLNKKQMDPKIFEVMGLLIVAIVGITLAMAKLASVNWGQILLAGVAVNGLLALLTWSVTTLHGLGKKQIDLKSLALIGALTVGLSLVIYNLSKLAGNNWAQILVSLVASAAILAEIVGLTVLLDKMKVGKNVTGALISIGVLAFSLIAIISSLEGLVKYDPNQILASLGGVSLVLLSLSASAAILSRFADARGLIGILVVLGIAKSLGMIAESLEPLLQFKWYDILATLGIMTACMVVLGGLVAALSLLASSGAGTVGVAIAAAALLSLGYSMKMCGEGALLFAQALQTLANIFFTFAENFSSYADSISAGLDTLSVSISNFVNTVSTAIGQGFVNIAQGLVNAGQVLFGEATNIGSMIIQGLLIGLTGPLAPFISFIANIANLIINTFCSILQIHSPSEVFKQVAHNIMGGLFEGMLSGTTLVLEACEYVTTGITQSWQQAEANSQGNGFGIIKGLAEGMAQGKGLVGSVLDQISATINSKLGGLTGAISTALGGSAEKFNRSSEFRQNVAKAAARTGASTDAISEGFVQAGDFAGMASFGVNQFTKSAEDMAKEITDDLPTIDALGESLGGAGGAASSAGEQAKHSLKSWQELGASLKDTIDNQMDIFSEFERKTDLTADQVLHNMRSQIEGVRDWSRNLYQLSARGLNSVLVQELSELGPQGYEKVNAFVQMTDEQLQEANELYAQRLQMPAQASTAIVKSFAATGMWGMEGFKQTFNYDAGKEQGLEVATGIKDGIETPDGGLGIGSPSKVTEQYGKWIDEGLVIGIENPMWLARISQATKKIATSAINGFGAAINSDKSGEQMTEKFSGGVGKGTIRMVKAVLAFGSKVIASLIKGIPKNEVYQIGYNVWINFSEGLTKSFELVTKNLDKFCKSFQEKFKKAFATLGSYAAEGLSEGIEKKMGSITKSITKVCKETIKKANDELKVKSPSRVFMAIGEYVCEGLAIGIDKSANMAVEASENVSATLVSEFQNAINKANDYVTNSAGNDMVLTPILDLSQVEDEAGRLGSIMNGRSLDITANIRSASMASKYMSLANTLANVPTEPQQIINNNNYEFNQTNNSPKSLTNAEIYRQTNTLFSRYRRLATS